jgi:tRNA pseudouridine38-40 synthase
MSGRSGHESKERAGDRPVRALLVSYDGAGFSGWQEQPARPTVQGELRERLSTFYGVGRTRIDLVGAGRTDSGVHALGQVASYHPPLARSERQERLALNSLLPPQIRILEVRTACPRFHALRSACGKIYRYRIVNGPLLPPFEAGRAWHVREPLDLRAMRIAARHLLGSHDFAAFAASGHSAASTTRALRRLEVEARSGGVVTVEAEADGFLYRMMRNITGLLAEVGRGRRPPAETAEILAGRSRSRFGAPAPPDGLFLVRVIYPLECDPFGSEAGP